jgi:transposase
MGRALRYILRNFRELGRFLRFAFIPPDNNVVDAALRRVALGRKNFLFVGGEEPGHDLLTGTLVLLLVALRSADG